MAQTWQAIVGSDTYTLSGGTLAWRLTAYNSGLPPVRRLTLRSPQQHGHTDLGFRYDAREMRLGFLAESTSQALMDARRDDLYNIFKALVSTPIKLKVTRDDGSVYQIDCYVTGVVDMTDDPNERIGYSQRFVVSVVCPDPMWYDPTQASTSFTEADNLDWWLALGTVDSGEVKEHVEAPTQGQAYAGGAIANGDPWSVFFRTTAPGSPGSLEVAVVAANTGAARLSSSTNQWFKLGASISGLFDLGNQADYMIVSDGATVTAYRSGTQVGSVSNGTGVGSSSTWRASDTVPNEPWTPAIPNGAIYSIALSGSQRAALTAAIDGAFGASKTIAYAGSFSEYPVITITGPITDPVLTNVSTGEVLDFTGITISGGDSYTVDCRFGYKTVKNAAGTNKIADLTSDSDLATFHLGADPEVSDGDNAITLTGTGTDSNTQVTVAYYNRYVGL